ncbi:Similar to Pcsk1: Neuroendocrine convertase 1 (Rattus norvegicus) [Cotesia congregata]|uniref:furin n=1 Tax=Cotesia congregata TaxID=51543 RepID=A0A8J2MPD1_COTCN|nr:Similar to Pcsk1: Neuroendocrine convertase 1 (Rattus norvegicus) [Cotesia congregata]
MESGKKFVINFSILIIISKCISTIETPEKNNDEEWVVKVEGGNQVASLLALQNGYKNLGLVLGFEDIYLWYRDENTVQKRANRFTKDLSSHSEIIWADQQKTFTRSKRDFVDIPEEERPLVRNKRIFHVNDVMYRNYADRFYNSYGKNNDRLFNDELWNKEWYLQDTRSSKELPKLDLNVVPLYHQGITGRGIRVAVLDDGLEYTHDDLKNNYDPLISYDVNARDNDPIPRYDATVDVNAHGTRCAGEIAMEANNLKCGVGIAHEASIGGIKLLDGIVNDRIEGEALGYNQNYIDIYTASWGPADDGRSLEAPGRLANEALQRGVSQGRHGRGNIYVWASGNGGSQKDDCNCDGYVGSIFTIAVGSASQTGKFPWYGEKCPATLATTYSSGAYHDQMIATTDLKNKCTTRHTGTSASAPLAAGILALALQVNKELTWRDAQHLVVETSEYSPLKHNPGWKKNSAGYWFNPRFGFGLMNAYSLVQAAANWTNVPDKIECAFKSHQSSQNVAYGKPGILSFNVNGCEDKDAEVDFLEHVQIQITLTYTIRGALEIYLTSPTGTRIKILNRRKLDDSQDGFKNWKFMSVATWGEDPRGTWTLHITDNVGPQSNNGTINDVRLIIHGTKDQPYSRLNGRTRIYNNNYNMLRTIGDEVMEMNDKNVRANKWNLESPDKEINLTEKISKPLKPIQVDWLRRLLFG